MKRTRLMIIIIVALVVVGALGGWLYTRGQTRASQSSTSSASTATTTSRPKTHGKTLIIYFSHAGGNYEGYRKVGNTAVIANYIKDRTHADVYQVTPAKSYPSSYQKLTTIATREQDNNARPAIKGSLPKFSDYQNIFVGSPIWNSEYPMIMRTLFDKANLNHKTLIPFVTHGGSKFGSTLDILKKAYPQATILKGYQAEGSTVAHDRSAVNRWLKGLGY